MNAVGKPRIIVADNAEEAAARAVGIIVGVAGESVARSGRFVAAISGGSTPRRMHRMLVAPPCVDLVPWEKTDTRPRFSRATRRWAKRGDW